VNAGNKPPEPKENTRELPVRLQHAPLRQGPYDFSPGMHEKLYVQQRMRAYRYSWRSCGPTTAPNGLIILECSVFSQPVIIGHVAAKLQTLICTCQHACTTVMPGTDSSWQLTCALAKVVADAVRNVVRVLKQECPLCYSRHSQYSATQVRLHECERDEWLPAGHGAISLVVALQLQPTMISIDRKGSRNVSTVRCTIAPHSWQQQLPNK